jgi:hypothetical protein
MVVRHSRRQKEISRMVAPSRTVMIASPTP